jgi:acyl-CoA thioesterase
MDARAWLGLEPTHNPNRWFLPVVAGLVTRGGFLFGGCGLGAAIEALEGTTGRPLIWATAQYLAFARPPEVLDIDVTVAAAGRYTTQARAVGHVADREILTVNAALGERPFAQQGQWARMPEVPPPGDCPEREFTWNREGSMAERIEQRWARPEQGDGRCAVWTRMPELLEPSAAALAVLGDFVPLGLGQTLEGPLTSNSLDNTLRVATPVPTEWVLLDIRIDVVRRGFGHGQVYLWAADGTLMATASQSAIVRDQGGPG